MMKKTLIAAAIALSVCAAPVKAAIGEGDVIQQPRATPGEAQQYLTEFMKAAHLNWRSAYNEYNGKHTLSGNSPKASMEQSIQSHKTFKDLYIFCIKPDGERTVYGLEPTKVGENISNLKDSNGANLMQEFTQALEGAADGEMRTVDYHWQDPYTKKISLKESYVVRLPQTGDICGCGFYKEFSGLPHGAAAPAEGAPAQAAGG